MGHSHHEGCSHNHNENRFEDYKNATTIGINALVVQCILVFISGSLALQSDTIHLGSDTIFLIGNLWVVWQAGKMTKRGGRRLKTLAAIIGIALLAFGSCQVFLEALERLESSVHVSNGWILTGGIIGLVANYLMYRELHTPEPTNYVVLDQAGGSLLASPPQTKKHVHDHVVEWHVLVDLFGSAIVILSAGISIAIDFSIDAYAGMGLAVFMAGLAIFLSWKVLRGEPIH